VLLVSHAATLTGAPRVALDVADALAAGHEVVSVTRRPGPLDGAFRARSSRHLVEPLHRVARVLRHWDRTRPLEAVLSRATARFVLRRVRPDVVYANTSESAGYVHPAVRRGLPVVLHVHEPGHDLARMLGPHRLAPALERCTLVAVSEAARRELAGLLDRPPSSIRVLPAAVDTDAVAAAGAGVATEAGLVGAVGSVTHRKGTDLWVAMAARVHAEEPGARFEWLGDDPTDAVAASVRELGIEGVVSFVPATPAPHPRMARYAVLTLPSREETAGLVVQEAMALGVPVVAFDLPAVAEQTGDDAALVPAGDVEAMAGAVVGLLRDEGRRTELGARGRRRAVETFSIERFRAGVVALVDESGAAVRR
jgi:glycosyltransferase involved in cell wall biosynthesis